MRIPRFLVAADATGAGKTTVALGLMGALAGSGLRVAGFKCGPDYIDPSYYPAVTGRRGRNVDLWMTSDDAARELFARNAAAADVAVVEGVMGLFDGAYPDGRGSGANVAAVLDAPVVLVLDAYRSSSSLGAVALGFRSFDPRVRVAGVVVNRVAGEAHERAVREAIARAGLPVLGVLPDAPEIALPERHLGLVPFGEGGLADARLRPLVELVRSRVDLDAVVSLARSAPDLAAGPTVLYGEPPEGPRARLAVARDEAFGFVYDDNLDLLRHHGVDVVEFSPLADRSLPEADGVWIGGGFPEVFAERLARNRDIADAIRAFHHAGRPIYGECGGFMWLGESLTLTSGETFPMAGVLGVATAMTTSLQALAYKGVTVLRQGGLFEPDDRLRGHEFHFSRLVRTAGSPAPLRTLDSTGRGADEGVAAGRTLASYMHVHLASAPHLLPRLRDRLLRP